MAEDHEVLLVMIGTDGIGDRSGCQQFRELVFLPEPLFVGSFVDEPRSGGGLQSVIR